jgi:hypothetical protein
MTSSFANFRIEYYTHSMCVTARLVRHGLRTDNHLVEQVTADHHGNHWRGTFDNHSLRPTAFAKPALSPPIGHLTPIVRKCFLFMLRDAAPATADSRMVPPETTLYC